MVDGWMGGKENLRKQRNESEREKEKKARSTP
jgi:hypothetical protein